MINDAYMERWREFYNSGHKTVIVGARAEKVTKHSIPIDLFLNRHINVTSDGIILEDVVIESVETKPARSLVDKTVGLDYFLKGNGFTIEINREDCEKRFRINYFNSASGLPILRVYNGINEISIEVLPDKK